jgi:coiled-coil domain-containing protein 63/114
LSALLLQERSLFDGVHVRLQRDVAEHYATLAKVVEATSEAYEARDAADMNASQLQLELSLEQSKLDAGIIAVHGRVDQHIELARK